MADYILSSCSTADITKEHFENLQIPYVCFSYYLDSVQHKDDLGQTIPFPDFYKKLKNGSEAKTSQVNVAEYIDFFTPFLEQGKDILHISLSSGISGAYNSAIAAAKELSNLFPERKILVIDSLGASSGLGLFITTLAQKRDEGMSITDLYKWAMENRLKLHHWFFSTDLSFYVKGGRISRVEGLFGTILNICPLLNMDNNGKLIPRHKTRGKQRIINAIVEKMAAHAQDGTDYSGKCFISNSDCIDDARAVATLVEQRFPHLDGKVEINSIGTTIGSHTGPGTVALFFWGDERKD